MIMFFGGGGGGAIRIGSSTQRTGSAVGISSAPGLVSPSASH